MLLQLFKKELAARLCSSATILLWTNLCKETVSTHVYTVLIWFCYFHFVKYRKNSLHHFSLQKNVCVAGLQLWWHSVIGSENFKDNKVWKFIENFQVNTRSMGFLEVEEEILSMVQTSNTYLFYFTELHENLTCDFSSKQGDRYCKSIHVNLIWGRAWTLE